MTKAKISNMPIAVSGGRRTEELPEPTKRLRETTLEIAGSVEARAHEEAEALKTRVPPFKLHTPNTAREQSDYLRATRRSAGRKKKTAAAIYNQRHDFL